MACQRMNKCHCHGVEFSTVAHVARKTGIQDLNVLCDRVGLGNTCTACRCDLADYLAENLRPTTPVQPTFVFPLLLPAPQR